MEERDPAQRDEPDDGRRYVSVLDALRVRPFAAYFLASSASSLGTWIQRTIAMVVIFDITQSAIAVGILAVATTLPILLFSLVAGYATDRFDRRRLIVATHAVSAASCLALAIVTVVAGPSDLALMLVALILATSWAFAKPALSAFFPSLVPPGAVRAATAANSLTFIVGQIIGPIVGTAFLVTGQLGLGFAVNGVTFLLPALLVLRLRGREDPDVSPPPTLRLAALAPVLTRPNLALLTIIAISAGSADVLRNLAPVVVDALGSGQELTGAVITLVSLGSAIGIVTAGYIARFTSTRVAVTLGLTLEGAALLLAGVWLQPFVVLAASMATGMGYSWTFIVLTGELQARTAAGLRGRAMSMHALAHMGMRPASTFATSAIAAGMGAAAALAVNGAVAVAVIAIVAASFRVLDGDR